MIGVDLWRVLVTLLSEMVAHSVGVVLGPVLGRRREVVEVVVEILRRLRPPERQQARPLRALRLSALEVPFGQIERPAALARRALAKTSRRLRRVLLVLLRLPPLGPSEHQVWPERVLLQLGPSRGLVGKVGRSPR